MADSEFLLPLPSPAPRGGPLKIVPTNYRTWGFCVLEGLVLSPVAAQILPHRWAEEIPAPDWLRVLVALTFFVALLVLPFWSVLALRPYRGLMWIGVVTFLFSLPWLLPVT